jgi:hypothetical protein
LPLWIRIAVAEFPVREDGLPTVDAAEIMTTIMKTIMMKITMRTRVNVCGAGTKTKIGMTAMVMRMNMKILVTERRMTTMTRMKMTGEEDDICLAVAAVRDVEAVAQDADLAVLTLSSAAASREWEEKLLQDRTVMNFMWTSAVGEVKLFAMNMVLNSTKRLAVGAVKVSARNMAPNSIRKLVAEAGVRGGTRRTMKMIMDVVVIQEDLLRHLVAARVALEEEDLRQCLAKKSDA